MFWLLVESLMFLISLHDCECERRILGGRPVPANLTKRYVVYLVRAEEEAKIYDSWLCGGAIVSDVFVITSAACVRDINYIYVVSGYNQYLNDQEIYRDTCFLSGRKRVIYICTAQDYTFVEQEVERWSNIDIAVIKVETPFNFNRVPDGCSYAPGMITVSYAERMQFAGTDVIVYGWGHDNTAGWRMPHDLKNYNKKDLHYSATLIIPKHTCKEAYSDYPKMHNIIQKYMLCTQGEGRILPDGSEIGGEEGEVDYVDHCRSLRHDPARMRECLKNEQLFKKDMAQAVYYVPQKDGESEGGDPIDYTRKHYNETRRSAYTNSTKDSRRDGVVVPEPHGICQNDHGGPLVAYRGMTEVLVGVASVFRVSKTLKCSGPFLFTSTHCTSKFLACVLKGKMSMSYSRKAYPKYCDAPPEVSGFKKIERFRSWAGHPDVEVTRTAALRQRSPSAQDDISTTRPVLPIG